MYCWRLSNQKSNKLAYLIRPNYVNIKYVQQGMFYVASTIVNTAVDAKIHAVEAGWLCIINNSSEIKKRRNTYISGITKIVLNKIVDTGSTSNYWDGWEAYFSGNLRTLLQLLSFKCSDSVPMKQTRNSLSSRLMLIWKCDF